MKLFYALLRPHGPLRKNEPIEADLTDENDCYCQWSLV